MSTALPGWISISGMPNNGLYKNQLQEYLQKASLPLPVYEAIKEGPSHMPKFGSTVTVNGVQYNSPPDFNTLKAAENAAAQVALEDLLKKVNREGPSPSPMETKLSKTILQEYAQKMNLPLPEYSIVKAGIVHSPTFCATVEIAGLSYSGGAASTKKEAESKAARTALLAIQAQACNAGSQVMSASVLGSQLNGYSGMKGGRDLEEPSEGCKDTEYKQKRAARDLEDPSEEHKVARFEPMRSTNNSVFEGEFLAGCVSGQPPNALEKLASEDASATLVREPQVQPQLQSGVAQHFQMEEEGRGTHQDKEQESREVQEKQQRGQVVALSRTMDKTDRREDKGTGQTRQKRKKNQSNKKAHKQMRSIENMSHI